MGLVRVSLNPSVGSRSGKKSFIGAKGAKLNTLRTQKPASGKSQAGV
ncbi:MAG TPA: hypothetical protein VK211_11890 [Kamptonema sp.]|nr:hypothetical protein [Kamptonema sp.]